MSAPFNEGYPVWPRQARGWVEPTGRANARPMINSAIPINCILWRGWVSQAQPILHPEPLLELRGFRSCEKQTVLTIKPAQVICPSGCLSNGASSCFSDLPKNISVFTHPKSILELSPSRPTEGRFAIVTDVGHGMRWTRQRFARDGIAGRVERLVSDQQRADERCCSVRRSRV